MPVKLTLTRPDGQTDRLTLPNGRTLVGASPQADIRVADALPENLILHVYHGSQISVTDLAEASGALLDTFPLPRLRPQLLGRSLLSLGRTTLQRAFDGTLSIVGETPGPRATDPYATGERRVNLGFVERERPLDPLPATRTLTPNAPLFLWLEIGELIAGALQDAQEIIDLSPLTAAELDVVLFPYTGELQLPPDARHGRLLVEPAFEVRVINPTAVPAALPDGLAGYATTSRRLFFPVSTPDKTGPLRLRCSIYYRQILLQSRVITVEVTAAPQDQPEALRIETDFVLAKSLNPDRLATHQPHRLSLFLNDNGEGTHGFHFFGENQIASKLSVGEGEVQTLLDSLRDALRRASWGDGDEYDDDKQVRYTDALNLEQLKWDLFRMAFRGYRFLDHLRTRLAGDSDTAWDFPELMRKPGYVQIASKASARLVLPVALFYDYPLNTILDPSEYTLCPVFENALAAAEPLEECPCFQGECPTREEDDIICPGGFWGYRHWIGMPVTVAGAPEAPRHIGYTQAPTLTIGVSTDPRLAAWKAHTGRLKQLRDPLGWSLADSAPEALDLLKSEAPTLVYFFCHGGVTKTGNVPFIQLGGTDSKGITRDQLFNARIRWRGERPLIFINGCHTSALEPHTAFDLVSGFIETSHAAGVIGTEITIFTPLATAFGEAFVERFIGQEKDVGHAIRGARLALLKQGNPLGLVYNPYAMADLGLKQAEG